MYGSVDGPYRSGDLTELRRAIDTITPRYYNHHGPGVTFFNLAQFYSNGDLFNDYIECVVRSLGDLARRITKVGGPESRAWPLAGALARDLTLKFGRGVGVVLVRKPGKLPGECERQDYETEYSRGTLEVSCGVVEKGDEFLGVDDLIATGGSMIATAELVKKLGGNVRASACPIELPFLGGRQRFGEAHPTIPLHSLLKYKKGQFHEDVNCYEMILMED